MKKSLATIAFLLFSSLLSPTALAFSGDLAINEQSLTFSNSNFIEGQRVRIYATVSNNSDQDLLGVVRFYDNDVQVSGDQVISIFAGMTDGVFVDWQPGAGERKVAAKIFPWEPEIDNPNNNWTVTNVYVVQDTDYDGIPNEQDEDDDGDGVNDDEDLFPLDPNESRDTDGDGIGDTADKDDDNDSVPDVFDDLPLDPNETTDTDGDGIGDVSDTDDDNDGLTDTEEENYKTDPTDPDTDDDGSNDKEDAFPLDENEWLDTDNDKIGNNTDTDDDNDLIPDEEDPYPLNKSPKIALKDESQEIAVLKKHIFDASPSFDEDGQIVSFLWQINDELEQEGTSVPYIFDKIGSHKVKLTVVDDSGESVSKEFQVDVTNVRLHRQLIITLIAILLALAIYFKYIAGAKNSKKK